MMFKDIIYWELIMPLPMCFPVVKEFLFRSPTPIKDQSLFERYITIFEIIDFIALSSLLRIAQLKRA